LFASNPESQQEDLHKNFDARPETQITKAEDTATAMKMIANNASNRSGGSNHSNKAGASSDDLSKSSAQTNSNGSTTTSGTGTTGPTGAVIPEAILATKETKAVHLSRIIVLAVFAISAAMSGGVSFWLFSESEKGAFKVQVQVSTFYFLLHYRSFAAF
jgi:hypothetical protein